jgi:signal transduction histidine kinase
MNTNLTDDAIYEIGFKEHSVKTDKIFLYLLVFEWILAVLFAVSVTPKTWIGNESSTHIHIYFSIIIGALITIFPCYCIWKNPGGYQNRYYVAVAQMVFSTLYIHLTGGRIETHFHVFGSLAFLAMYRDIKPVILATVITTADHIFRGIYAPQSLYGILTVDYWRALEHAAWVFFEDIILFVSINSSRQEMNLIAMQQNQLEAAVSDVELRIAERTEDLLNLQVQMTQQQQVLAAASKMSVLGEMAGGIAHEINTPLAVIQMRAEQILEEISTGTMNAVIIEKGMRAIDATVKRISKIVNGLRTFSRDGNKDPFAKYAISKLIEDTFSLCQEKFKNNSVDLRYIQDTDVDIECRPSELSQVILNLLNNSYDAIEQYADKWVEVRLAVFEENVELSIIDSGPGIPIEIQEKLMQPFFTTKEVGKGTGLGLSISRGIIESHNGKFWIDNDSKNTCFKILIPISQNKTENNV